MKIAYVCYWNLLSKDGVAEKINAQANHWRRAGHVVDVFCLSRAPRDHAGGEGWTLFHFTSLTGRVAGTRRLVRAVRDYRPDLVYLRYDLFVPPPVSLLTDFASAVEINSDDRREALLRRRRAVAAAWYNELNRRAILGNVAGAVCVTHELARSPAFASFGKPTEVIANGVDLDRIRVSSAPSNERPRVAFLGSRAQTWHGVDKILWLASALPNVEFDIVGYDLRDLDGPVTPNVHARGVLSHEDYEAVLASSDVAIGTLALHRKEMTEACPLKVREYLAHGVPVVVAYDDTDFLGEDPWYMLRLPNEESNVRDHVGDFERFIERVRGRRVPRDEIAERVGAHAKEGRRLAFFGELAAAKAAESA